MRKSIASFIDDLLSFSIEKDYTKSVKHTENTDTVSTVVVKIEVNWNSHVCSLQLSDTQG